MDVYSDVWWARPRFVPRKQSAPGVKSHPVRASWLTGAILAIATMLLGGRSLLAGDWPMWRYDAYRSASSPDDLPDQLHLAWTRQYAPREQVWDDALNNDMMPYDKVFEPVIMGSRMFLGFNDRDKVVALDIDSGRQLWEFFAGGPVRLPPVAWREHVYFASDDGHLYCVRAKDGELVWKFRGGPSPRKVIGNRRIISAWPARGGPVIRDGHIYFAASIWPFMGTFIYALDAESGAVVWVNDSTGSQYIKQPHGAPSFAGVAPQGALVATQDMLLVPGGRSVPAAFDRMTGSFKYFHIGGKAIGGSFVCADEQNFFVHTRARGVRACDLKKGEISSRDLNEPVLCDGGTISFTGNGVQAFTRSLDFTTEVDGSGDVIKAGNRIFAAGQQAITALDTSGRVIGSYPVNGQVGRLLAGGGKLVAVTLDGRILVYGDQAGSTAPIQDSFRAPEPAAEIVTRAQQLVQRADAAEGYALWYGADNTDLLHAVLSQSKLRVVVVDPDEQHVNRLRAQCDAAGLYGSRVAIHDGDPLSFEAPPYIANLIVVGRSCAARYAAASELTAIYESVRPYGGALWIDTAPSEQERIIDLIEQAELPKARIVESSDGILILRTGSLPGAADWTHQNGDIANTVKSNDRRVKLPLGVLWFGGNSHDDILPRHGHGPPEQVIGGRTFLEGMDCISARDTYTGRVLWKRTFDELGNAGVYFDATYKDAPLDTAYNQVHIPGANGRGTNFVATDEEVFIALGNRCEVLDARTGATRREIELPPPEPGASAPLWSFIGVYGNILLGGCGFANYTGQDRDDASRNDLGILDMSASAGLAAFDRDTGQLLWQTRAKYSFLHNGIVAGGGRVYCLDKFPGSIEARLSRRGLLSEHAYRIVALDARTGDPLWQQEDEIFGTWLSYSEEHDILLLAGAAGSDRLPDEVGQGMTAYQGKTGTIVWRDLQRSYTGPCVLHNGVILTNFNSYQQSSGAFSLLDGSPHLVTNPITGAEEPWRFTRTYGCNSMVASEHLLTFRSGAAGFYDLAGRSGTGNFGGFRSGCTSNLIAASGVLSAPDYTRTCSCTYQNQTSLALVHMPDIEIWTKSNYQVDDRIDRVGINLGAPGDRLSSAGTLWFDYPSVGGESPRIQVTVKGQDISYFCRHASAVREGPSPWITASGVRNVESVTIKLIDRTDTASGEESAESAAATDQDRVAESLGTVRLYFAEPDDVAPGERICNISLQGNQVLEQFDLVKEAGGRHRSVVKQFSNVTVDDTLRITLRRPAGQSNGPVLSGVEFVKQR